MKTEDLAYAAGVIDSDGCIFIYVANRTGKPGNREFRACVNCAQTTPQAIKHLHKLFGGSTGKRKAYFVKKFKMHSKPQFVWKVATLEAKECVKALLPYLKIKKKQAQLVVKFFDYKESTVIPGKRRTDRARKVLDRITRKVSSLNSAKGKKRAD